MAKKQGADSAIIVVNEAVDAEGAGKIGYAMVYRKKSNIGKMS